MNLFFHCATSDLGFAQRNSSLPQDLSPNQVVALSLGAPTLSERYRSINMAAAPSFIPGLGNYLEDGTPIDPQSHAAAIKHKSGASGPAEHFRAGGDESVDVAEGSAAKEALPAPGTMTSDSVATDVASSNTLLESQMSHTPVAEVPHGLEAELEKIQPATAEDLVTDKSEQTEDDTTTNHTQQSPEDLQAEWESDSSPYTSSSPDSSSEDDSDDETSGQATLNLDETVSLLIQGLNGEDNDEQGPAGPSDPVRSKNELPEDILPIPEVNIDLHTPVRMLGTVKFIFENSVKNGTVTQRFVVVVVQGTLPAASDVLSRGTVVCTENRDIIGALADTIGSKQSPVYTLKFHDRDRINALGIRVHHQVFYPPQFATTMLTEELEMNKGIDASDLHDEELAPEDMEFSDDEKEAEHKRKVKDRRNGAKVGRGNRGDRSHGGRGVRGGRVGRVRGNQGRAFSGHPGALDYEDDDGPYTPLARPASYGQGSAQPAYHPNMPAHTDDHLMSWGQTGLRSPNRGRDCYHVINRAPGLGSSMPQHPVPVAAGGFGWPSPSPRPRPPE